MTHLPCTKLGVSATFFVLISFCVDPAFFFSKKLGGTKFCCFEIVIENNGQNTVFISGMPMLLQIRFCLRCPLVVRIFYFRGFESFRSFRIKFHGKSDSVKSISLISGRLLRCFTINHPNPAHDYVSGRACFRSVANWISVQL